MKVTLKPPIASDALPLESGATPRDGFLTEGELLPTLDVSRGVRRQEVSDFMLRYTSLYFHIPLDELAYNGDLAWLERRSYALTDGVPIEEAKYGRIFIKKDGSGGISDKGFVVWIYLQEITDAMGLDIAEAGPPEDTVYSLIEFVTEAIAEAGCLAPS